jgi:hypothetical protein
LAKIANSDGSIHDNESSLFKMAASHLNAWSLLKKMK